MTGPLLRPRDVAKLLLVSEQTIRNLASAGEIAGVYFHARNGTKGKNRKTLRFTEQAVADFIHRNTVELSPRLTRPCSVRVLPPEVPG